MRKTIIIAVAVLLFVGIGAAFWLMPSKPKVGPWKLPDGSEISLAGVTYRKNHVMRYGDRLVDYLYPVLPNVLRSKFGCKVMSLPTPNTNAMVVWLWDNGAVKVPAPAAFTPTLFYLTTVDEHGTESWFAAFPTATTVWKKTNILYAFEIQDFPRRNPRVNIEILKWAVKRDTLAKFAVPNRTWTNYPVWIASALPISVKTNGIEVSLVAFETLPQKKGTPSTTRLGFRIPEDLQISNNLTLRSISARSATGLFHESAIGTQPTVSFGQITYANLGGALWQEEPAWQVTAEFWRSANFPDAELWAVKGIAVPEPGQTREIHVTTNIYDSEIELVGITGGRLRTNNATGKVFREPAILHLTSPIPSPDIHLRLAEVKDDHGRTVEFKMDGETPSTGGRGATVRQLDKDYALVLVDDARSVDVTLAYTKSVSVEFMVKPTMAKESAQK